MFIGIDLGTTHSLIGLWREGGVELIPNALGKLLTPSVVSLGDASLGSGDGEILVGEAARDRLITHPALTAGEFKRSMGTDKLFSLGPRKFTPEELSALVLRSLKADAEHHLRQPLDEAVISVPAYFNARQRQATLRAAQLAGLRVEQLVNEPTAAALAYGLHGQAGDEKTYVVLDLGGGTFDVSIIEIFDGSFEIHASGGDNHLGGNDFTDAIFDDFCARHSLSGAGLSSTDRQRARRACEELKTRLTTEACAAFELQIHEKSAHYELDRDGFQHLCQPLWDRVRHPIVRTLGDANLRPGDLSGVILVGGATRMPAFRSLAARLFGTLPMTQYQPDHAIAMGAAAQAMLKSRERPVRDIVMTDVCPYTLGVAVLGPRAELEFLPVIERNTTIPVSETREVHTAYANQAEVRVDVYQGESFDPAHNVFLGSLDMAVAPTPEPQALLLTYTYDVSGLLEVEVTVAASGERRRIFIKNSEAGISEELLAQRFDALAELKTLPRDRQENVSLLARLDRLFQESLGERRAMVGALISQFRQALGGHQQKMIQETRERIVRELEQLEAQ